MIDQFHWIRPFWLIALLPFGVLLWFMFRHKVKGGTWESVCDHRLLPHILLGQGIQRRWWPLWSIAIAGTLTIFAIAGPAWERLPQPVYQQQSARVLVLDLSLSMDATDIGPTRLTRARHKILDILEYQDEGYTSLIVYAGEPFVVTPLTQDVQTIKALVPTLKTDLMPAHGSRPDLALKEAVSLIEQAGMTKGHIVLLTDGIDDSRVYSATKRLSDDGHRLSVLAVGTKDGAPIVLKDGSFLKDMSGSIVLPKMDEQKLRVLASDGGGRYTRISIDDSDVEYIMADGIVSRMQSQVEDVGLHVNLWKEEGPWLLFLILPIAAMAFRRGYLVLVVSVFLLFSKDIYAFDWNVLWSNSNQRGSEAFMQGNPEYAAKLFSDPQWKAAAQYRAEQFDRAVESLDGLETASALYNKGNALAHLGRFPDAIHAYDAALKLDDAHEDARYNKKIIEDFLERQPRQQDSQREGDDGEPQLSQQPSEHFSDQYEERDSLNETANDELLEQDSLESAQQQNFSEDTDSRKEDQAEAGGLNFSKESSNRTNLSYEDAFDSLESQQAYEQWIRRIPDDPGGLLRRKFLYQYEKRGHESTEKNLW